MKQKKLFILAVVMLFILSGCAPKDNLKKPDDTPAPAKPNTTAEDPYKEKNQKLIKLLPEKEGYTWIYNGFAEYGHKMTLQSIVKEDNKYTYSIDGMVEDASGGEAGKTRDFSLQITYTIEKGSLIQSKKETMMLDSPFDRLELIRAPLEKGTKWQQEVKSRDNKTITLECSIDEIKNTKGKNVYTVNYRDKNSDYFEKREITEGIGIVSFEKLLVLQDQSFPAGYFWLEEFSGYNKNGSK